MEGHLVHGVAVLVCLVKGAPAAGSFDVPEFVENIVQDEGGRTAFFVADFADDALPKKVEADLGQKVFMGEAVLVPEFLHFLEDVVFEGALDDRRIQLWEWA